MKGTSRKRGRPPKAHPKSAAERMRAYRQRQRAAGLKSVSRWVPAESGQIGPYSDHRILDARSLALHCKIAQKVSRRPELLDIARNNVDRWTERSAGETARYLREWARILDRPLPEILQFITCTSEEAMRLRQSSPFTGILDAKEREQVYAAFRS